MTGHGKGCKASLPYPYLSAQILLFQLHSAFMSDSEIPAKDEFSNPSGVNVWVNEVVPEIPGHAREGRNQNTQRLLGQALGVQGIQERRVPSLMVKGNMEELAPSSSGTGQQQTEQSGVLALGSIMAVYFLWVNFFQSLKGNL